MYEPFQQYPCLSKTLFMVKFYSTFSLLILRNKVRRRNQSLKSITRFNLSTVHKATWLASLSLTSASSFAWLIFLAPRNSKASNTNIPE